jgi:hypothetical protein
MFTTEVEFMIVCSEGVVDVLARERSEVYDVDAVLDGLLREFRSEKLDNVETRSEKC